MSGCIFERAICLSKFRGSLVGVLMGDCLGSPYEGDETVSKVILQRYFDSMENPNFKSPLKKYTDDTAMSKAIAESLILNGSFNEVDIAKRFVTDFFAEPRRGYGEGVITVFRKLRNSKFADLWCPAREQFNGSGSLGNGGAMRIAPIALFYCSDYIRLLDKIKQCTKLTHTHRLGVNGALLQGIAIQQSFQMHPQEPFCVDKFVGDLVDKMAAIEAENKNDIGFEDDSYSYQRQMKVVQDLLKKEDVKNYEVLEKLGNGVQAFYSVPTAIYCFLRAQQPINQINTDNKFRRALQYSISLGGDTDTIASMAGAISGAYHGYEYINKSTQAHCEGLSEIIKMADDLHDKVFISACSRT